VHKGSTQTNKKIKERVQKERRKETQVCPVWRTGLSCVPPDSVRCTRTVQLRTRYLRVSPAYLRYNSPNCPVCHWTVRCTRGATALQRNGRLHSALTALQFAAEVRAEIRGAPNSEQYLSGVAPDYPVPQEVSAPMVNNVRTLMVG
jgi:hypothetical protein